MDHEEHDPDEKQDPRYFCRDGRDAIDAERARNQTDDEKHQGVIQHVNCLREAIQQERLQIMRSPFCLPQKDRNPRSGLSTSLPSAGVHAAPRFFGSVHVQDLESLSCQFVIVDEELLEFLDERLAQIVNVLNRRVTMVVLLDRHETIVSYALLAVDLLAFDDADESTLEQAAGKCRFIHQNEHIDRIAVVSQRRRYESEVVRKGHTGWKYFLEREHVLLWIEGVFVPAVFWSFDDHLNGMVVLGDRLESKRIAECASLCRVLSPEVGAR